MSSALVAQDKQHAQDFCGTLQSFHSCTLKLVAFIHQSHSLFFALFAPCNGAITRVAAANEFFPFFLVSAKVVFSML